MSEIITPAQRGKIEAIKEEIKELCSTPLDEKEAEKWITALYKDAGYAPPQFIWFDSPYQMHSYRVGASLEDSLWDLFWNHLCDSLQEPLMESSRSSLGVPMTNSLWHCLCGPLLGTLRGYLKNYCDDSTAHLIDDVFGDLPSDRLWEWLGSSLPGREDSLESEYFFDYLALFLSYQVLGAELEPSKMSLYEGFLRNTGHICPYKNVCLCSHRPISIGWGESMFVEFRDGWGGRANEKSGATSSSPPDAFLSELGIEIERVSLYPVFSYSAGSPAL